MIRFGSRVSISGKLILSSSNKSYFFVIYIFAGSSRAAAPMRDMVRWNGELVHPSLTLPLKLNLLALAGPGLSWLALRLG